MSGRKQASSRPVPAAAAATATEPSATRNEGLRETVEAIAIAFILAFVFKTFQAELYVIPTGSMAPTLFGRHKEAVCTACQYRFTMGASHEVDQDSGIVHMRIRTAECPNCHFENEVTQAPVFNGDRILVNKLARQYQRFDVVVFKNPEEPHVNYIKRLVGLPGETIRVRQGDVYARRGAQDAWRIQRKADPNQQRAIQLLVYDDRYPAPQLLKAGGGERWFPAAPVPQSSAKPADAERDSLEPQLQWQASQNAWQPDYAARTYQVAATDGQTHWLRYQHLIPSASEWEIAMSDGRLPQPVDPSLVVDFCGFNSFTAEGGRLSIDDYDRGLFWVSDLTLNATVDLQQVSEASRLTMELVDGERSYRCEFQPSSGLAEFYLINRMIDAADAQPQLLTSVKTGLQGSGQHTLSFANVDNRLCLWVNGQLVPLGDAVEFNLPLHNDPTDADLTPVGIAARDLQAQISDLVLQRDIYYRNDTIEFAEHRGVTLDGYSGRDSPLVTEIPRYDSASLTTTVKSPRVYAQRYQALTEQQQNRLGVLGDYQLDDDEYLMFGDNSPASKDSRLFDYFTRPLQGRNGHRYAVHENHLIGEALFVFWPHGVPFLNNGQGFALLNHREQVQDQNGIRVARGNYPMYRFPFYPNVSRMQKIR